MLIRVPREEVRVPYRDGPGHLAGRWVRRPLRARTIVNEDPLVVVAVSRRAARALLASVVSGAPARAAHRGSFVEIRPVSPTECEVTMGTRGGPVLTRVLYVADVRNVLNPLV